MGRYISIEYVNGHCFDLIYYDDLMDVRQLRLDALTREEAEAEAKLYLGLPPETDLVSLWQRNQNC